MPWFNWHIINISSSKDTTPM